MLASVFVSLRLLSLLNLQDSRYDPIPEFESLLSHFTEKPRTEDLLLQMGSYYLFIKDDLTTAYRQYWSKVISENPDSERLKVCNISVIVASYIIYTQGRPKVGIQYIVLYYCIPTFGQTCICRCILSTYSSS